jgi:hypothetical protein
MAALVWVAGMSSAAMAMVPSSRFIGFLPFVGIGKNLSGLF